MLFPDSAVRMGSFFNKFVPQKVNRHVSPFATLPLAARSLECPSKYMGASCVSSFPTDFSFPLSDFLRFSSCFRRALARVRLFDSHGRGKGLVQSPNLEVARHAVRSGILGAGCGVEFPCFLIATMRTNPSSNSDIQVFVIESTKPKHIKRE